MQQSDETALAGVSAEIERIEGLCNEIELSLRARDLLRLDVAVADSRRAMNAFENEMAQTQPLRNEEFDRTVFVRLQRVFAVREDQMKRLEGTHRAIGEQLRAISRWKQYARSVAGPRQTRPPALFQELR